MSYFLYEGFKKIHEKTGESHYDLTKFNKDWSNIVAVGAKIRLYSQSFLKAPARKML